MATDLTVRFGGDATALNAVINQAKQTLASFAPQTTGKAKIALDLLAATMAANADSANKASDSWRDNINVLASLTTIARGAVDGIKAVASAAATTASATTSAVNTVDRSLDAAFQHATDGLGRYIETLAHGSGEARSFLHEQEGMFSGIGRMVAAAKTSIDSLGLAFTGLARAELNAIMASGNGQAFVDAVGLANVKQRLDDFTASLLQIPGISREAAGSIEVMLATIPGYTEAANQGLINLIATISKNGDEAVSNATKISAALKDPTAAGGATIADMVGALADKLKASEGNAALFKAQLGDINTLTHFFSASLQPAAAAAYFDAILAKIRDQATASKAQIATNEAALKSYGILSAPLLYFYEQDVKLQKDANAERERAIGLLQGEKDLVDKIAAGTARTAQAEADFLKAFEGGSTPSSQIKDLQDKLDALKGYGQSVVGGKVVTRAAPGTDFDISDAQKDRAIRAIMGEAGGEGPLAEVAVANVIQNRLVSGRYGDNLDKVLTPEAFNALKPGKPALTADPSGLDYMKAKAAFEKVFEGIDAPFLAGIGDEDPTHGGTHFQVPNESADKSWYGSMTNKNVIGKNNKLVFGNTPDSPKVLSDDDEKKRLELIPQVTDSLKAQQAIQAGGTEVEKASLEIAKQRAAGIHDEVGQAQMLLDAHKRDAATAQGGTQGKQRAEAQATAEATIALSEKQAEVEKANFDKRIAQTETGSQEWLRITLQKYEFEEARARGNTAEIERLETQKLEAAKTANKQAAADAAATENASYANKKRSLADQLAAMKANEAEGSLSAYQVLQQTKAIQDQETALERRHLEDLARIWSGIPAERRKIDTQLAELDAKRISEGLKTQQQFEEAVVSTYRQSMEEVASTVSSSLLAIQNRTGTLRDLLRNVVVNIETQFLNAGLKMAADWAVNQTKQLAVTVATQAGMTSAVATGTAAQTGLLSTASIEQAALASAAALKSIVMYAAEAAAGATAFTASFLGPAAIGVGTSVEAAVMSLASFDKGAWSLPSDQLAMVHRNEMVVPAFQAETFRQAVANMAGGGGGGGDTNNRVEVHIHPQRHHNENDIADAVVRKIDRISRGVATKPWRR